MSVSYFFNFFLLAFNVIEEDFFNKVNINKSSLKNEFEFAYSKFTLKMDQLQYLYSYQLYINEKNDKVEPLVSNSNMLISNDLKLQHEEESQENRSLSSNPNKKSKREEEEINISRKPKKSDDMQSSLNQEVNRIDRLNSQNKHSNSNSNNFNTQSIVKTNSNEGNKINNTNELKLKEKETLENAKCRMCKRTKTNKLNLLHCYSDYCSNIFCQDCYNRNYYQTRASNIKCNYFDCDSCGSKKLCIMSTIFCPSCEKRVCYECYFSQHMNHGSFKIFN